MGNIGDTISDSAPAVSTSGPGYAATINALLTEFKTRLSARIPLSSLLTNSNLDLNGQALLNAAYLTLANESTSPVASPVNRVAAYGGNLWWVSPSGAVQVTSGAALNAAGVGGITGDYSGAGPMEFRYDLANTRYDAFSNQATNTWAYLRARGLDIAGSATSAFRMRQIYNGSSNNQVTWGATMPASGYQLMLISDTGQMDFNTGSLNNHITLTGTAEYKHGARTFSQTGEAAHATSAYSSAVDGDGLKWTLADPGVAYVTIKRLRHGERLLSIKVSGASANEPSFVIKLRDGVNISTLAHTASLGTIVGTGEVLLTLDTPYLLAEAGGTAGDIGDSIVLKITSGGSDLNIWGFQITYDRP